MRGIQGSRESHLETLTQAVEQLRPALLGVLLHVKAVALLGKLGVLLPQLHQEAIGRDGLAAPLQVLRQHMRALSGMCDLKAQPTVLV